VEAVDHLMNLAYLRQLHQADQAYTRRLLDDNAINSEELKEFNELNERTMLGAVESLGKLAKTGAQSKGVKSGGHIAVEAE
jgi:hypothetical protein